MNDFVGQIFFPNLQMDSGKFVHRRNIPVIRPGAPDESQHTHQVNMLKSSISSTHLVIECTIIIPIPEHDNIVEL